MRTFTLALGLMAASPLAAQESCFCLKCILSQYQMAEIFGEAMAPTLITGQCKLIRNTNADSPPVTYGDIAFFQHPALQAYFIERVVAFEGDTVEFIDGRLWLNGTLVPQERIEDFVRPYEPYGPESIYPECVNTPDVGGACVAEQYVETLPNMRRYNVLNIGDTRVDNTDLFSVPAGFVFVLGDNRDNSVDSRFSTTDHRNGVGFVPVENIIGILEED